MILNGGHWFSEEIVLSESLEADFDSVKTDDSGKSLAGHSAFSR